MQLELENFPEIQIVARKIQSDSRGVFRRIYDSEINEIAAKQISYSGNKKRGTLRGMHYLEESRQEFKLIECISGSVLDVVVDCRTESVNFLNHATIEISAESDFAMLIPPGFAHGYLTLEDNSNLIYSMSAQYEASYERGIRWNDPKVGIDWPVDPCLISLKDSAWPLL